MLNCHAHAGSKGADNSGADTLEPKKVVLKKVFKYPQNIKIKTLRPKRSLLIKNRALRRYIIRRKLFSR